MKTASTRWLRACGLRARGLRGVVRRLRWPLAFAGLIAMYPVFVLATVYVSTARSDFPGGRHGPRDAYRHSLASAIVAYTGSPRWVDWVTGVMEKGGQGDRARAMDAHNNLLGARIGARAESWSGMRAAVSAAVRAGGVDQREADRITWLPSTEWQERAY